LEFKFGGRIFGRYRIDSVIGQGGFGVVYSAWDEWDRKQVAIKILTLSAQTSFTARGRFSSECDALVELSHPNIIHIFDSKVADKSSFVNENVDYPLSVTCREKRSSR
jgi:serine/threonine-protein kinase